MHPMQTPFNLARNRWRLVAFLIGGAILASLLASTALADVVGPQGEAAGPLAPILHTGGSVTQVQVVTESVAMTTSSVPFVDLPGATATVTIPAGSSGLILARFSGESRCSGGVGAQWCSVRVLIGGVEADPVVGADFAFDSTDNATETTNSWESHSIERVRRLGAGTYTVKVQWAVTNAATSFRLDDWAFTVERTGP
jgi:hypothetical protein